MTLSSRAPLALVLRPEPGNAATAARLQALGIEVARWPLFAIEPVAWTPPDPARHDALLLTSANAVRHAGPGLHTFAGLPVLAVGTATAAAARTAGLTVALTGDTDAAALVAAARAGGWVRLLHLAGRDRHEVVGLTTITVHRSEPVPVAADRIAGWVGTVALLHSPRAARRFAALVDDPALRATIDLAALSPAVAIAAGSGWRAIVTAAAPRDDLLVAAVGALIDPVRAAADKRA